MKKRYEYRGTTVRINEAQKKEFTRLLERGVLISLQQNGVLSISQLEQCLAAIETQKV